MLDTVKTIIEAKSRAGQGAFLWLTYKSVATLYENEAARLENGIPLQSWELNPIERDQIIESGHVDDIGVSGCNCQDQYGRVEMICGQMLEENDLTDPILFDRITNRLAAEGVEIDQAATAKARTESPNVIAVFKGCEIAPEEWDYIEIAGKEMTFWGYSGEIDADLLTVQQIRNYYDDPPIEIEDLAGLRYIGKDGEKLYDEADIKAISDKKDAGRAAKRETLRNLTLFLPDEFLKLCEKVNETPAAILQGFIADLCHLEGEEGAEGYITNGSDERMFAEQYFDRCGY